MKKALLSFLLSCCAGVTMAQNIPNWENPEVFAVNKEETRATSIPYPDENMALKNDYEASPWYRPLDGMWKFRWVPTVAEIPVGFEQESYDIGDWGEMPVPGNWEFNGHGIPMYVNTGFGFRSTPPLIDRADSPVGAYRHTFDIPDNWDGRRVFIHFEGGTTAMYVWVNGKSVGYTENSKSPAEFDITPYIRKGRNTLACQVHRFSDGSYIEDQDMWRMGGINRSVYLYSTAPTRIRDFFAHPDIDKNYRNGVFSVDVTLKNYTSETQTQTIEASIVDKAGRSVLRRSRKTVVPAAGEIDIALSGDVSNPLKWTAETPNLYTLILTLKNASGKIVESTSHKIGFRKVEIRDGQLLVNGKKVYFKGVNLHEFNTNTGQVVTRKEMMRNIQLMKELNINAVRTSHYPQQPLWYRLCDEYGIYLVDEANQESHGLGYGPSNVSNRPEWLGAHMDRIIRLVERDKNHASVIFWSLGNESGNGVAFFETYDWAKARDDSRPVQYEQAHRSGRNTDIFCPMYPSWESMVRDATTSLEKPFIMCEYAHAMGNSMGNFQDYWDLMRSSKNMQGGFIWEWYNHGYPARDEQGRFYWAYGGDLGGYGKMNNDNFCMDGIVSPDQNYIPHTNIVKKVYQNILFESKNPTGGVVTVVNDFKFIPITPNDHSFRWVLLKNGEKFGEGDFTVSIPADTRKDVQLALPAMPSEAGTEYFLQVYAHSVKATEFIPAGFEVAKGEFAISKDAWFSTGETSGPAPVTESREGAVTVRAGEVTYSFSTRPGRTLVGMRYKNRNVFRETPHLNFWHAPTDNEFGEGLQRTSALWSAANNSIAYTYKGSEQSDAGFTVRYEALLTGLDAGVDIVYTVNRNGSLTVNAAYRAFADNLPEMVRFGMVMSLPADMNDFTWYGRGPWENYIDRNADTFMGIYNDEVERQAFEYYRPQETGNKTDVRWLTLKGDGGIGIKITGAQPLSVSATNYRQEDLDPGMTKKQQHWSDVLPRGETVLCVDLFQRGVGGLNSWGAKPLDRYRFTDREYSYGYTVSIVE